MSRMVPAASRPRILFSVNASWNVVNFRSNLLRRFLDEGYAVTVASPRDAHSPAIEALGCRFVDLPMQPHGRSPVADLALLARYVRLLRAERPDVFLSFTPKPNIYGSLAAALLGVPAIGNIAGLGVVFNETGPTNRIVRRLYRLALRRSAKVFFQNPEHRALFVDEGIVPLARTDLLPGSGVDLARFVPTPRPSGERPFVFLLVARLLWEKGIAEFVAAGRLVRAHRPDADIRLLGYLQDGDPAFVAQADIDAWQRQGDAIYLGTASDVRPHLAEADCIVLPSYYAEGTPRALLEAAAMGKPIITCDMPGCRDVVTDGQNGHLVPPRDVATLAARMAQVVALPPAALAAMGRASRVRAESTFDERIVLDRYVAALRTIGLHPTPADAPAR